MHDARTIPYRPAIDGLRAIAVTSVLLFHLDKKILPGGFVGVDIFFVISGYLITSILVADKESGSLSLARFYQRRVARILPVLAAVILATLIAASFIYTDQDLASTGALSFAAALSIANLKLMLQGSYFVLSPDAQPLMHFWSLSVEEQFYLFLPVMLMLAHRFDMPRIWLSRILVALATLSLFACLLMTVEKPEWAFYLLPTRAWELLVGAWLAVDRFGQIGAIERRGWPGVLGLTLLALSFIVIQEGRSFPGYIALLPALGAALIIGRESWQRGAVERWLAQPLLVFIGKLSYSAYLWHWPVYSFVDYRFYASSWDLRLSLKVVLTCVLTIFSFYVVESPLRTLLNQPRRRRLSLVGGLAVLALCASLGWYVRASHYVDADSNDVADGGVVVSTAEASIDAPRIVLMGDSNGAMYAAMFREVTREAGVNANSLAVPAGNPMPGSPLFDASMTFLKRARPQLVVLAAEWTGKVGTHHERLQTAIAAILEHSSNIVIFTQPPILPSYATREGFRLSGVRPVVEDATTAIGRRSINDFIRSLRNDRVHVVDVERFFVGSNGEILFHDEQGRQLDQDPGHVSGWGANRARIALQQEISGLAKDPLPRTFASRSGN